MSRTQSAALEPATMRSRSSLAVRTVSGDSETGWTAASTPGLTAAVATGLRAAIAAGLTAATAATAATRAKAMKISRFKESPDFGADGIRAISGSLPPASGLRSPVS